MKDIMNAIREWFRVDGEGTPSPIDVSPLAVLPRTNG